MTKIGFLSVVFAALLLPACVTPREFETESRLLEFRESKHSAVMVLLPDTLRVERRYDTGADIDREVRQRAVPWPHGAEADMARLAEGSLAELAPTLRLRDGVGAAPFVRTRPVKDCLNAAQENREEAFDPRSASGMRGVWTDPRPVQAGAPAPRRAAPDTVYVLSSPPPDSNEPSVCRTLAIKSARTALDVDYAILIDVVSITVHAGDGWVRVSVRVEDHLIALRPGVVVAEHQRVFSTTNERTILGTQLLGAGDPAAGDAEFVGRLVESLRLALARYPLYIAHDYGYVPDKRVDASERAWARSYNTVVDQMRAAITP